MAVKVSKKSTAKSGKGPKKVGWNLKDKSAIDQLNKISSETQSTIIEHSKLQSASRNSSKNKIKRKTNLTQNKKDLRNEQILKNLHDLANESMRKQSNSGSSREKIEAEYKLQKILNKVNGIAIGQENTQNTAQTAFGINMNININSMDESRPKEVGESTPQIKTKPESTSNEEIEVDM